MKKTDYLSGYTYSERTCEKCAKKESCKKSIGFLYGFCISDFSLKDQDEKKWKEKKRD